MGRSFFVSSIAPFFLKQKRPHLAWQVCRGCFRGGCSLLLWVFWLALAALLFLQARIAMSDEIAIPETVLRGVEQRLAERGLRFTMGAIHCDSGGRVVVRDLSLFSTQHPDPVLTVRAVRFQINPYALWVHDVAPRAAVRIDGASLRMPAMFSIDGTNAAVIDDINTEMEFKASTLFISGLTARAGNLAVMCRGAVVFPGARAGAPRRGADVMPDIVAAYIKATRKFDSYIPQLDALGSPVLDITLAPDERRFATARIELTAGSLRVDGPEPENGAREGAAGGPVKMPGGRVELGPLVASTTVALGDLFAGKTGDGVSPGAPPRTPPPLRIQFSTTDVVSGAGVRARNARASLTVPLGDALMLGGGRGVAQPAGLPQVNLFLLFAADSVSARDVTAESLTARVRGQFPRSLRASLGARVLGEPVALETSGDLAGKTATAHVETRVSQRHIAALSRELKYDVGAILKPARPMGMTATARFGPGWRFTGASGALDIGPVHAYRVNVDRAKGAFTYDPGKREILFSPAKAVVGESFASGSFWMNLDTFDFRFLLAGRLRPPSINGWLGAWWPVFWSNFSFGGAAPFGDVDVQGNFRHGERARVFVFADASNLTYRKVAFDHVLLSLFVRPDYFDALDLFARRGGGYARGTFTHQRIDPGDKPLLTVLDFKAENIDPVAVAPAVNDGIAENLAPLKFDKPPARLRVAGRVDGPASPRGEHVMLDFDTEGAGAFSYDGIPLATFSASVKIRDDVLNITRLESQIAGGHLTLKAQLSGADKERRLGFDLNITGASFGQASRLIEELSARKRGVTLPPPDPAHMQPAKAQLDMRLSADGFLHDDLSFTGGGSAEVSNAELVNVNLFGALSQALRDVKMLNFTSLHLTGGQANFTLDGRRVQIPEAVLTGQKALVKLSGDYMLDNRFANLTAKVYPLSESKNILGKGLGFLLVPFTHLTELKLTGSLDAPKWRFSYGPTSFFRALAGKGSDTESLEREKAEKDAETAAARQPVPPETLRRPVDER